ncbi:MAG: hypothetical protein KatS3mg021_2714 [Fimbriimonadales bacterium]|nr:MAG: hypothetical protein KatS3mg021_2714 [Fimbriimonadales bacterium]
MVFLVLMVGVALWLRAQNAPLPLPDNWSSLPEEQKVRFLLRYALSTMYPQSWLTRAIPPRGRVPALGSVCERLAAVAYTFEIDPAEVSSLISLARSEAPRTLDLIHAYAGATYARKGLEQKAHEYLNKLVAIPEHRALIQIELAVHYAKQGRQEVALLNLNQALAPKNLFTLPISTHFSRTLKQLALQGYHKEIFGSPTLRTGGNYWLHAQLLHALTEAGKLREVEEVIPILDEHQRSVARALLASHALRKRQLQEALRQIRSTPKESIVRVHFAAELDAQGYNRLANQIRDETYRAIRALPKNSLLRDASLTQFAAYRVLAGDVESAEKILREIGHSWYRMTLRKLIAAYYMSQQQWELAHKEVTRLPQPFPPAIELAKTLHRLRAEKPAEKTTEFELPEVHDMDVPFVWNYLIPVLRLTPAEKDRMVNSLEEWLRKSPEDSYARRAERAAELMRLLGRYEEAAALIYTLDTPADEKHGYVVRILISMMDRRESGVGGRLNSELGLSLSN